ncbi:MAG: hypothetical protein R3E87_21800 [Burkholderiaceae bacterium]
MPDPVPTDVPQACATVGPKRALPFPALRHALLASFIGWHGAVAAESSVLSADEFLALAPFMAQIVRIDRVPGPPSLPSPLAMVDLDLHFQKDDAGRIVVRATMTLDSPICGTLTYTQPIPIGLRMRYPESLSLKAPPDCVPMLAPGHRP